MGPASKRKTFHSVVPRLFEKREYSYDQMLDCCAFLGRNYEKFVELFLHQTKAAYGINTGTAYFDCTNFYFEIDRQCKSQRKKARESQRKRERKSQQGGQEVQCGPF